MVPYRRRFKKEMFFLEAVRKGIGEHLAATARQYNVLLPVYRLSNEILVKILLMSARDAPEDDYFRQLHILACVSSRWAKIIIHTPSLWAFIHSSHSEHVYLTALAKSKNYPLEIVCRDGGSWEYMDAVLEEAHRWRCVTIEDKEAIGGFEELFQVATPRLEVLEIDSAGDDDITLRSSRLRHLTLTYTSIHWDYDLLSGLRILEITDEKYYPHPRFPDVTQILHSCPNLVAFLFSFHDEYDSGEAGGGGGGSHGDGDYGNRAATRGTPIDLPYLTALALDTDSRRVQAILESVRIPACTHLYLSSDDPANHFSEATAHLRPLVARMVKFAKSIDISLSSWWFSCSIHSDFEPTLASRPTLTIKIDLDGPRRGSLRSFLDFLDLSEGSPPVILKIRGERSSYSLLGLDIAPILERLPSTRRIRARHYGGSLVEYLSQPSEIDAGGVERWPLPDLQKFELEDADVDPLRMREMVQRRAAQGLRLYVRASDLVGGDNFWPNFFPTRLFPLTFPCFRNAETE